MGFVLGAVLGFFVGWKFGDILVARAQKELDERTEREEEDDTNVGG